MRGLVAKRMLVTGVERPLGFPTTVTPPLKIKDLTPTLLPMEAV